MNPRSELLDTRFPISNDIYEINRALSGFTDVVELNVKADAVCGALNLALKLANAAGETLCLCCTDVSSLELSGFGGGLTQLQLIRGIDVSENQLDRVKFHFSDLEGEGISFDCASVIADGLSSSVEIS